uniref:Pentatricopeptide repeat-containing protein At4g21170 n=1 Tax=Anthurium amnicola TaxID=1678845 RepID=A0A1D1ZJV2_9ARAE
MLLKLQNPSRLLCFGYFSTVPASLQWRNRIHRSRLVAHVVSLLLQRKHWPALLLPCKPSLLAGFSADPTLFLQLLHRTQSQPHLALDFFRWAEATLGFQPDLRSRCKMVKILVDSGLLEPAKGVLEPALRSHRAPAVLDVADGLARRGQPGSALLGFLLEEYALLGRILDGLEAFRRIRASGCPPISRGCNLLLDRLISSGEIKMAWCFYAAVVRSGAAVDPRTWFLLARLLCKEGKLERALMLVDSSIFYNKVCHLVIDSYSRNGDFASAIRLLKTICEKDLRPGFGAYSSILDGGCRYKDAGVVGSCVRDMVVTGLLPTVPLLDYDLVIQRLCELEKTFAAEMFLERAWRAKVRLDNGTYSCLLRALSKVGRVVGAMRMYQIMSENGMTVKLSCLDVFLGAVCTGEPSAEGSQILKDAIGNGFVPSGSDISKYIASQCSKGWWEEANNLLNLVLEKGILPDTTCCASFIQRYCAYKLVDSAVTLLEKLKKLGGGLDVTSYNELLDSLTTERRLVEAIQVFDHMREQNVRNSTSFFIMITALCNEKELKKAMNLHDEMLKVRLKPDEHTYKHLISGFA